jgi:rubrerythrin
MKRQQYLRIFALLLTSMTALTVTAQNQPTEKTLEHLQAAFNGEQNAHGRYLAFAKQAEQEGYAQAANLFRAAAKAEGIHASNHAAEIKRLGGTPQATVETPLVKSTKDNLEVAIKGETYERDSMYPEFRHQAREVHNMDAVRTFNFAYNAEAEHAKLFTEAYNNLENMRAKTSTYYVCTVCGYTMKDVPNRACRSCYSSQDKFEQVS